MAGAANRPIFVAGNESGQFVPFGVDQIQAKGGQRREISLPVSRALKHLGAKGGHTSPRRLIGQSLRMRQRQILWDEESKLSMSLVRPRKAAHWRRGSGHSSLYVRRSPWLGLISISPSGMGGAGSTGIASTDRSFDIRQSFDVSNRGLRRMRRSRSAG